MSNWWHQGRSFAKNYPNINLFMTSFGGTCGILPRSGANHNHTSMNYKYCLVCACPAMWLFVEQLARANIKGNIKPLIYCSFVRKTHWWPVDSPLKGPMVRKRFPYHEGYHEPGIMKSHRKLAKECWLNDLGALTHVRWWVVTPRGLFWRLRERRLEKFWKISNQTSN